MEIGVVGNDLTGDVTGTATTATNLANAANITTGTINVERLGSGADAAKFLRGDNTWQTVSGGGGGGGSFVGVAKGGWWCVCACAWWWRSGMRGWRRCVCVRG